MELASKYDPKEVEGSDLIDGSYEEFTSEDYIIANYNYIDYLFVNVKNTG